MNRRHCSSGSVNSAAVVAGCLALCACGARRLNLPTDPGVPFPDAATVYAQLSAACTAANTLTAELGLSGRAGQQKLRGRALAGFARPDAMRLEGVAPFGAPAFILASRGRTAWPFWPSWRGSSSAARSGGTWRWA